MEWHLLVFLMLRVLLHMNSIFLKKGLKLTKDEISIISTRVIKW